MGKVYIEQDNIRLYVETETDLTNFSVVKLAGIDPDDTEMAELTMSVEDASSGLLSYDVTESNFTTAGKWKFWVHVYYEDGAEAWGEPFNIIFYEPGN